MPYTAVSIDEFDNVAVGTVVYTLESGPDLLCSSNQGLCRWLRLRKDMHGYLLVLRGIGYRGNMIAHVVWTYVVTLSEEAVSQNGRRKKSCG